MHFTLARVITMVVTLLTHLLQLVVLVPHGATVPHHTGHRGVDDDVAADMDELFGEVSVPPWYVQVSDALAGVDHSQPRPGGVGRRQVSFHLPLLGVASDLVVDVPQAVVGVHAKLLEQSRVLSEDFLVVDLDHVTEQDGVGDLHHGGLEVQGHHEPLVLAITQLRLEELCEGGDAHPGGVDHFPGF